MDRQRKIKELRVGGACGGGWEVGGGLGDGCVIFLRDNFIQNFYYNIIKKITIWMINPLQNNSDCLPSRLPTEDSLNYQNNLNYYSKNISNIMI